MLVNQLTNALSVNTPKNKLKEKPWISEQELWAKTSQIHMMKINLAYKFADLSFRAEGRNSFKNLVSTVWVTLFGLCFYRPFFDCQSWYNWKIR